MVPSWRSRFSVFIVVIGILAWVSLGDESSPEPTDKPNEGLSTSSDTLAREKQAISLDGLSEEQIRVLTDSYVNQEFSAAVDPMMKLIINSLYKNKEIFLRELISNASDALEKIRLLSLKNPEVLDALSELAIYIKVDKDAKTLEIRDSGVGMTKEDLINNLGTIAKSGTAQFLADASKADSDAEKSELIGQFGVGFYSSFLVADRVVVFSKENSDKQYVWESDSKSFKYAEDPRGDTLKRGTKIVLHLNDESSQFLEPETLKKLIKNYSQFINFPIHLWNSHTEKVKIESTDEVKEEKPDEGDSETSSEDASVEDEKKEEDKFEDKLVWDWEHVNAQKPLWKKKPADVKDEEYAALYHTLATDTDEPLGKIHFTAEGDITFTSVLFIPKRAPGNMMSTQFNHKDRIKMFVHQVLINDGKEELLPRYLGFILGMVDSDELPVNVSRETLQQTQLIKYIYKKLVRKVLEMIKKLSDEDFEKFWKEYGVNLKLGMIDDHSNRSRLSKLLRYRTSKSGDKLNSLADYVSRMKSDQKTIYYLTASSKKEAEASPFTERLVKQGFEVIYMVDPIDEYVMQTFTEYEKFKLQDVAKEGVSLDKAEDTESRKQEFEELLKWFNEDALKDKIEKAVLSERLSTTPCALVASSYGWSGNMQRVMHAQAYHSGDESHASFYTNMKKTLEINPRHPIIKELKARVQIDKQDTNALQSAELLFDLATLRSGFPLPDAPGFAQRIEGVMKKYLEVDPDAVVDEEPALEEVEEVVTPSDDEPVEPQAEVEDDVTEEPDVQHDTSDTGKDEL